MATRTGNSLMAQRTSLRPDAACDQDQGGASHAVSTNTFGGLADPPSRMPGRRTLGTARQALARASRSVNRPPAAPRAARNPGPARQSPRRYANRSPGLIACRPADRVHLLRHLRIFRFACGFRIAKAKEAIMTMEHLSKVTGHIEIPRRTRKKLRRISKSPTARSVAALVPLLTIGVVAARILASRRSSR